MREAAALAAFLLQQQALLHAEALLFVDDHECERVEFHFFLEQRMRADDEADLA